MPTIIDETVASAAYDTSGNGGRKITSSNNDIVMVVKNGTTEIRLYKRPNGGTSVLLANFAVTSLTDVCIENAGNGYVGILYSHSGSTVSYRTVSVSLGTLGTVVNADAGQSAVGNVTMIANDTRSEMFMGVVTKNSTYANSFNIRFNKGTINTDGSVTWGVVEQVTSTNQSGAYNIKNPSIILFNGVPTIAVDRGEYYENDNSANTSGWAIQMFKRDSSLVTPVDYLHSSWSQKTIFASSSTYVQSSPSAIFVPQSINGLANGRIWVAWDGTDSANTTQYNVKIAYSDDGGLTWSPMQKLTDETLYACRYPSITASKSGEVSVLFAQSSKVVKQMDYSNGTWSPVKTAVSADTTWTHPSALLDMTAVNYTEPLFIYQGATKVGFYGTWTTTEINVTPGHLGEKTDRTNLLTYSITTEGTMSTITEKVNGVVIGTKTATSGEVLIAGLTQEQWDAVRFGKYADATGGKNTLTIEMGSDLWTYTFDKRPATDADILSAVKAVQDSQEVYLPNIKRQLVDKVGGNVADTFEAIIEKAELGTKKASGTITISGYDLVLTGLGFKPSVVVCQTTSGTMYYTTADFEKNVRYHVDQNTYKTWYNTAGTRTEDGCTISMPSPNKAYDWKAYE